MDSLQVAHTAHARPVSPLMMADRLITLAQDADHAGYRDTASHLVSLVYTVLDHGTAL